MKNCHSSIKRLWNISRIINNRRLINYFDSNGPFHITNFTSKNHWLLNFCSKFALKLHEFMSNVND